MRLNRESLKKLLHGRLEPFASVMIELLWRVQYVGLSIKWVFQGGRKPTEEEQKEVVEKVTFFYKSFERQKSALRLYRNIQKYYPGVKVIVADDSKKPLKARYSHLDIIQLPFNSGLSYGLNCALEKVGTPYVVRMDDDQLLTPFSQVGKQLKFLEKYQEISLVGLPLCTIPKCSSSLKAAQEYFGYPMTYAPKPLLIPHMMQIDESHVVVGKSSNTFVARTEKIKELGYDNNIRMIDHQEFFIRAAGNIVSTIDISAVIFHYPNHFNGNYMRYRSDVDADVQYIREKYSKGYFNIVK